MGVLDVFDRCSQLCVPAHSCEMVWDAAWLQQRRGAALAIRQGAVGIMHSSSRVWLRVLLHGHLFMLRCLQNTPLSAAAVLLSCLVCRSWNDFTAGFTVGALSGVAWAYACTQFLPYYS